MSQTILRKYTSIHNNNVKASEAATHKCSQEKVFWKYAANLQLCNFIEIALRHGCSTVSLLHIFRTPFPRNTYGWLLLKHEDYRSKITI